MTCSRIKICPDGPDFSRFVMGYWRLMDWGFSNTQLIGFIEQGLELGITTVDHADIYGDYRVEGRFGRALAQAPGLRERLEIVTKCGIGLCSPERPDHRIKHYDTSRSHILASVDRGLANLRTDYIDLLLLHRPDPLMDADQVADAFLALRALGKVRYFGVSNFNPHQFELLQDRLPFSLVTNQLEISPYNLPVFFDGHLDLCQRRRISPMAWSCLGGGRLFTGEDERSHRLRWALAQEAAAAGGCSPEQLVYAWVLAHPSRPLPLIGSGRIERLRHALESEHIALDRQGWFHILQAAAGADVP